MIRVTDMVGLEIYSEDAGDILEARPIGDGVALHVKRGYGLGNRIELDRAKAQALYEWLGAVLVLRDSESEQGDG
jgi:hypothetical protein